VRCLGLNCCLFLLQLLLLPPLVDLSNFCSTSLLLLLLLLFDARPVGTRLRLMPTEAMPQQVVRPAGRKQRAVGTSSYHSTAWINSFKICCVNINRFRTVPFCTPSLLLLLLFGAPPAAGAWLRLVLIQELPQQVVGALRLHVGHHVARIPDGGKRDVLVVHAPATNLRRRNNTTQCSAAQYNTVQYDTSLGLNSDHSTSQRVEQTRPPSSFTDIVEHRQVRGRAPRTCKTAGEPSSAAAAAVCTALLGTGKMRRQQTLLTCLLALYLQGLTMRRNSTTSQLNLLW
jgi:hypothetical protein